jgi:PEP-CTERM motif
MLANAVRVPVIIFLGSPVSAQANGGYKMNRLLKFAAIGAAAPIVLALATPASAELEIFIDIGGHVLTCAASAACNTSASPDKLTLAPVVLDGVAFQGEEVLSTTSHGQDILSNSVLSVTNTNAFSVPVEVVVSDTDYPGPVEIYNVAGAGTFVDSIGSVLNLNFFADAANGQGADGTGATPGTNIFNYTSPTVTLPTEGVSLLDGTGPFFASGPVSITERATYSLAAGGQLLNRGMSEVLTVVPEPSTWAMMIIGFAGLGYAAFRRGSKARSVTI